MKRSQASARITDAIMILRRVRDEYLATKQAWPQSRNSIQPEISNLEDLAEILQRPPT